MLDWFLMFVVVVTIAALAIVALYGIGRLLLWLIDAVDVMRGKDKGD